MGELACGRVGGRAGRGRQMNSGGRVSAFTDGQMHELRKHWMYWMAGGADGQMEGQPAGRMDGRMDGWMDGLTDGLTDGRMDRWTDRWTRLMA